MSTLKICPYCGGHGYINQFEDIEGGCRAWAKVCIACNGTGTILCQETNADRIREMSDEELAEFLADFKDCAGNCFVGKGIRDCSGICATKGTLETWLRQTAKEDT